MSERMSDDHLRELSSTVRNGTKVSVRAAFRELREECDRARASESALLARVAELVAAAAGETGTPKAEGRYMVVTERMPRPFCLPWYKGAWRLDDGWPVEYKVTRYWRLPGETYTEKPHDT